MNRIDAITADIIEAAIGIHRGLGPALLENAYELVLAADLVRRGHKVDRQVPVDIEYDGLRIPAAFRADLLVDDIVVLEIKAIEAIAPVHAKQVLTYLRLMHKPVGLLLNFSGETMKEGIRRLVNNYQP